MCVCVCVCVCVYVSLHFQIMQTISLRFQPTGAETKNEHGWFEGEGGGGGGGGGGVKT